MTNKVPKTYVKDKTSAPYPRNGNSDTRDKYRRCGRQPHGHQEQCPAWDQVRFKCGSTGHLKAVCRTKVLSTNASTTMYAPMKARLNYIGKISGSTEKTPRRSSEYSHTSKQSLTWNSTTDSREEQGKSNTPQWY